MPDPGVGGVPCRPGVETEGMRDMSGLALGVVLVLADKRDFGGEGPLGIGPGFGESNGDPARVGDVEPELMDRYVDAPRDERGMARGRAAVGGQMLTDREGRERCRRGRVGTLFVSGELVGAIFAALVIMSKSGIDGRYSCAAPACTPVRMLRPHLTIFQNVKRASGTYRYAQTSYTPVITDSPPPSRASTFSSC
jgi:hypothetical protein